MVVFFPRPTSTYTRRRSDSSDSDDEPGARYYYVRLESVSSSDEEEEEEDDDRQQPPTDDDDDQQPPTARGRRRRRIRHARLILEVPEDDEDDYDYTDEEEESGDDNWDPCLHLGELPLRPMSRFCKAFIDVLFVVATVAVEGGIVWTALQQNGANWFNAVTLILPLMILILFLAAFFYMLVTSDFTWRPAPAPADEKV